MTDHQTPPPSDPREQVVYWKRLHDRLLSQHSVLRESHDHLRKELDEFTTDSRALEEELESEVKRLEREKDDAQDKVELLRRENEEVKTKLHSFQIESGRTINQLAQDLDNLRYHQRHDKERIRGLEIANDELERLTRTAQAEIEDLKSRYNQTLERNVFLQHEAEMLEQLQTELQRVKDELRDAHTELELRRAARQSRASLVVGHHSPIAHSETPSLNDTLHPAAPSSVGTDQSTATTAVLPPSMSMSHMGGAPFSPSQPSLDERNQSDSSMDILPTRTPNFSFGDLDMGEFGADDAQSAVERTKRMSTAVGQNVNMLQDLLAKAKGIEQRIAQARAWYISPLLQSGQQFPGPPTDGRTSPGGGPRSSPYPHIPTTSERGSERGPMPAFASALYPPGSQYPASYDDASSTGASSYARSVHSFGERLDTSRGRGDSWGLAYASQQMQQNNEPLDDDSGSLWSGGVRGGTPQPGDGSNRRNVSKREKSRKSVLGSIIPGYTDWVASAIGKMSGDRNSRREGETNDNMTDAGSGPPRTPQRSSTGGWFSGRLSRSGSRPGEGSETSPDRPPSASGFGPQRIAGVSPVRPNPSDTDPGRRSFSGFRSPSAGSPRTRAESVSPGAPVKKTPSAARLFGAS
ncbi:hypothetical protein M427DRAFT_130675 [Gonapodya prolifera JEL478]|uniref:NUDE domain-containing protein n=1 Tax=Gonapodya prolifera (strain JEL478) TaxID=1344416 RepID=A0A139AWJ6_GONPJ|nr:hypothetical protein M427DRAFT_130675 [Gonapodya prolifera JEL478]|eukprot:KXS21098.1 hypothetical protein M427DRAFT_130675 [Gonapodya prolifera JEL478]